jgi:hypothetical protein
MSGMPKDITTAKKELYSSLKAYNEVVGSAVRENNGDNYIVIYLNSLTDALQNKIPRKFKGFTVKTLISGDISAY